MWIKETRSAVRRRPSVTKRSSLYRYLATQGPFGVAGSVPLLLRSLALRPQ